jgi:hypothetical protein
MSPGRSWLESLTGLIVPPSKPFLSACVPSNIHHVSERWNIYALNDLDYLLMNTPKPVLITTATAREYAARSNAAQAAKRARQAAIASSGLPGDPYLCERLRETRDDIVKARARLNKAKTGSEFNRIADAIAKLSELERQLAGRPLPGTLKPEKPKPAAPKWTGPLPE